MKIVLGISGIVACTVLANILLKVGASLPATERFLFGILGWHGIGGFALWVVAAILYAWVLQWLPLNVAQSFLAAQFVGVILASALVLAEPISALKWLGMALITTGIVIVGAGSR